MPNTEPSSIDPQVVLDQLHIRLVHEITTHWISWAYQSHQEKKRDRPDLQDDQSRLQDCILSCQNLGDVIWSRILKDTPRVMWATLRLASEIAEKYRNKGWRFSWKTKIDTDTITQWTGDYIDFMIWKINDKIASDYSRTARQQEASRDLAMNAISDWKNSPKE